MSNEVEPHQASSESTWTPTRPNSRNGCSAWPTSTRATRAANGAPTNSPSSSRKLRWKSLPSGSTPRAASCNRHPRRSVRAPALRWRHGASARTSPLARLLLRASFWRSDGNRSAKRRMRGVVGELDVLEAVVEEARGLPLKDQPRQRARLAGELDIGLLEVVDVEVAVASRPDELARQEPALRGNEVGEQRVGRDVERDAEEDVGAALIELAGEASVGDVELEQQVARRELHFRELGDVPGGDDQPARVRIAADLGDDVRHLVDGPSVGRRPASPLAAVDRPELAVGIRPLVPDRHARRLQRANVGLAAQKPQELVHDRLRVQLLRRDERETLREVEAHLVAEYRQRPGAGAVALAMTVVADMAHEVEIGLHAAGARAEE